MTYGELKRLLAKHGCTFANGRKHTFVYRDGRYTVLPRHTKKEIKPGTLHSILAALGFELKDLR